LSFYTQDSTAVVQVKAARNAIVLMTKMKKEEEGAAEVLNSN